VEENLASQRDRVLDFVARFPGLDDDEIASALKITPRQAVNQICRKLCQEHLLYRELGKSGKLANSIVVGGRKAAIAPQPADASTRTTARAGSNIMSEDQVKAALVATLEPKGWSMEVAWGRNRGIDIVALRGNERWVIECKGTGSLAPMQNNYFVGVIGELMQRMNDEHAKHSIAFPNLPKFRRLWSELPVVAKERLRLTALFVSEDGSVVELAR
jgi:hypothetical protein